MPQPCTGGYQFGNRVFRCWEKKGHGIADARAGDREVVRRVLLPARPQARARRGSLAGGVQLGIRQGSGIDLPEEKRPAVPDGDRATSTGSTARADGRSGVALNLSIGQGENSQTVLNMARFYTALATDGIAAAAARSCSGKPERDADLRADAGADGQAARGAGRRRVDGGTAASVGDQGRAARRQDRNGADRTLDERHRARSRVVRGLRARRTTRRSSSR